MKKSHLIVLILINSILSLVFIILSYFGIIRYISMHTCSTENLIEKYSKLPTIDKNTRVVLSIAPGMENLSKIRPMINSILDQTIKVSQLCLILPLENLKDERIPGYLHDIFNIIPCGKNYGDGNVIIPILMKEKESDSIIVALDHRIVYGKDFVETVVEEMKDTDSVIVDKQKKYMVTKPKCYKNHVFCDVKSYDFDWFTKNTSHHKILEYTENYTALFS